MATIQVQKLQSLTGHTDCVYTLAGTGDPAIFFSGAGDGMIVRWDLQQPESGELIARLPNSVYALALHPSGLLVAGHNYEGIHLLDWQTRKETGSLKLSAAAIFDIQSFGSDILVASGDGSLTRIDVTTLTIQRKDTSSARSARTIAIDPTSGDIAVGYSDNHIRIFDSDLKLIHSIPAHAKSVFSLKYIPGTRMLLSGSRDARLRAWDGANSYSMAGEVVAHMYAINHMDFSPDNKHFVTCSMDKSIKVWQTDGLKLLKVIDRARHAGHGTSVNKVLWTSFNNQLISASDDRTISVWHIIF